MPHKRSVIGFQKRLIRGEIFCHAFHDKLAGEVVSLLSRRDVLGLLNFEGFSVSIVPEVERGEVLVDSRGRGSFQKALRKGE
jgi:hypothetical protein